MVKRPREKDPDGDGRAEEEPVAPIPGFFLAVDGLRLKEGFVSEEEERSLIASIDAGEWNTALKRRTQHFGYDYDYKSKTVTAQGRPLPEWSLFFADRLVEQGILAQRPDQLLVNEYKPGQGIAPHIDNAGFEDGIVSISLGSDVNMLFVHHVTEESKEGRLPRRSALSLHGDARYVWRHGIVARKKDNGVKRGRRVSITFRKKKEL